ncbi:SdpI family protein [Parasporobacterium paucivorans]|uniref:SdpI/YhfL protein family protein n=1 Tax=Parasporobacterium paucivorans DSM 15970 TaxID=1122934 RepID=A0A1M6LEZ2_9FIRM|nr:SdpI family protein [Parasporobacterium paucivorans]SHJ69774.1 SdpI/YhfL protein family protein [Parasporobacterium paucivorans DSM 15970]
MNKNFRVYELIIGTLSFITLILGFFAPDTNITLIIIGIFIYVLLIIFHVNTPKIANLSADNPKVKTMRRMNVFSLVLVAICFGVINWSSEFPFLKDNQGIIEFAIVIVVIIGIGNIAPQLPFNRYMGLRLPWTIRDEETWKVAHRILGYLTFPIVIIILIGGLLVDTEEFAKWGLITWVAIPSLYSCYYYYLRISGKK